MVKISPKKKNLVPIFVVKKATKYMLEFSFSLYRTCTMEFYILGWMLFCHLVMVIPVLVKLGTRGYGSKFGW